MQYNFILKNDRTKNFRLISQLLVIFNLIGLVILLMGDEKKIVNNILILTAFIFTVLYIVFAISEIISKNPVNEFWHRTIFGWSVLIWMFEGFWWIGALLIIFIILDYLSNRRMIVKISDNKITLPAIIEKNIEWNELNNVILKDGLLTIDFKNNKLFQHLILNAEDEVDENSFNSFCNRLLNK